jgi:arabinan endo-1,5-alpha-L-arabinosidase
VVSRNWLVPGRYTITNTSSNLRWEAQGCAAAANQRIVQNTGSTATCQQWDVTTLGESTYQLVNVLTGQSAGTVNCGTASGTALQMEPISGSICQEFQLERAIDDSFIFSFFTRPVEATSGPASPGTPLQLSTYSATSTTQRWRPTLTTALATTSRQLPGLSIYPVPAAGGKFTVDMGRQQTAAATSVAVFTLQGQRLYQQSFVANQSKLAVEAVLLPGIYLVQVRRGDALATQKLTVQ